jgi:tetratricopeptide (TPR) repeat protein
MNQVDSLNQRAIDAAIAHKWEEAVNLNKKLLDLEPQRLDAHLRLGFAYLQLEDIKKAKKFYQQALKIQSKNPVALENLERIAILEEKKTKNPIRVKATLNPSLFLEIPGKTKSVSLVNLGQKNHIAELDIGENVALSLKRRKVEVRTVDGDYIGVLPDDLSKRLIFFIENKSSFLAYVKEAGATKVVIFIREEKKGPKVMQYSSFPTNANANMYIKEPDEDADQEESDEDEWEKIVASEPDEEVKNAYQIGSSEEEEDEE